MLWDNRKFVRHVRHSSRLQRDMEGIGAMRVERQPILSEGLPGPLGCPGSRAALVSRPADPCSPA